jgi:glycosyltransferase involved in cell wall biosynthesis
LTRAPLVPGRDHFFGFNTNSLETLEFLKERGVFTIVDQVDPGRIEEEMVRAEARRWPGWEKVPGSMPEAYWQRLRAEWETADAVLVNSEWSRDALVRQGVPAARIMVVPLAINLKETGLGHPINTEGRLKVIWLGSVILRKGIQYLVEAARILEGEDIEFKLVGPLGIADEVVRTFPRNLKVLGRVTRDQLDAVYRDGQVFVLPTISDGFAITQLEAMARGLPVVTTPNCGRVVTDGVDGLIVPARDGAALAGALSRLNQDRELLSEMSRNALETVKRFDLPGDALLIQQEVRRLTARTVSMPFRPRGAAEDLARPECILPGRD